MLANPPVSLGAMVGNPPPGGTMGGSRAEGVFFGTAYTLVPGIPFGITKASSTDAVLVVGSQSASWTPAGSLTTPSLFTFAACDDAPGTPLRLCAASGASVVVVKGGAGGREMTLPPAGPPGCDAPASWGVMLFVDPLLHVPYGTVLLYQDPGTGSQWFLNASSGALTPAAGVLEFNNPPGFVGLLSSAGVSGPGASTAATRLVLPTGAAAVCAAAAHVDCWAPTAAGCPFQLPACAMGDTNTGAYFCGNRACSSRPTATEVQHATAFLTGTCAAQHSSGCLPVAGTAIPATCSGWSQREYESACAAACSIVGPDACDAAMNAYCAANPSAPDCACIQVRTNPLQLASFGGRSYPQYACHLVQDVGVSTSTQLRPECWWPTCAQNSKALKLSTLTDPQKRPLQCPPQWTQCATYVSQATRGNPDIQVQIQNACTSPPGVPADPPMPPCSELLAAPRSAPRSAPQMTRGAVVAIVTAAAVLLAGLVGVGAVAVLVASVRRQNV